MSLTADAADGKTGYRSNADLQTRTVFLPKSKMFASAHLSPAATAINRCRRRGRAA